MSVAEDDAGVEAASVYSEPWEPLSLADYGILGFVGTFQMAVLLICIHLLWWRKWPPYVAKSVNVVIVSTLSGVAWNVSMAISFGYITREPGDILAACEFENFLTWTTLCVHTVAFFIRVYRMWKILIKHDQNMWHTEHQILLMSSVSLIPVVVAWAVPDCYYFDEVTNACLTTTISTIVVWGMDWIAFLAICFLWFVCARDLKSVRKQFNEYETMKRTLLYITIALLSYAVIVVYLLADKLVVVRRVAIFYPMLTTYILLWGSIREPFTMKMLGDEEYLLSYTKGFAQLPSPAQLRASLAEQLSVEQLREEFRRYIKTRVAQELIDFYLDSLEREEVTGFFERQAVTMRIMEQYVREGAPDQVNISEECREKILLTDVTAFDIFDEARQEVLAVMETNFQRDFVTTEGFRRIVDASKEEQRELRLLRAGGILPLGTPSPPGSNAEKTPPSSSPQTAALLDKKRKRPPRFPLIPGLVSAFQKLPFMARNGRDVSESCRRQQQGRDGGARVGGSPRLSADSIGASWGGGGRVAPEGGRGGPRAAADAAAFEEEGKEGTADLVVTRKVQMEEIPSAAAATGRCLTERESAGSGTGGESTASRDIEMAERGARDDRVGSGLTVTPEQLVWTWAGGSADRKGAGESVAADPDGRNRDARVGGQESPSSGSSNRAGHGCELAEVAVRQQPS